MFYKVNGRVNEEFKSIVSILVSCHLYSQLFLLCMIDISYAKANINLIYLFLFIKSILF